ncbi:MAG: PEP-CTERM sorting domain-containing protein [Planctomycetota bacterium]|jgi:hypothetical protein
MNGKNRKIEKYIIGIAIGLFLSVCFLTKAETAPAYGVATGGNYYSQGETAIQKYQDFFASGFVSGADSDPEHGFGFDIASTSVTLNVWTNVPNVNTWLMAESNFIDNNLSIGGTPFNNNIFSSTQIAGYTSGPYLGFDLGTASLANGWTALTKADGFNPQPFLYKTFAVDFDNALTSNDLYHYFFAVGDYNNDGIIKGKEFSMKATSSQVVGYASQVVGDGGENPIPEPTTVLLLGIGLAGLVGEGIRRRRKSK